MSSSIPSMAGIPPCNEVVFTAAAKRVLAKSEYGASQRTPVYVILDPALNLGLPKRKPAVIWIADDQMEKVAASRGQVMRFEGRLEGPGRVMLNPDSVVIDRVLEHSGDPINRLKLTASVRADDRLGTFAGWNHLTLDAQDGLHRVTVTGSMPEVTRHRLAPAAVVRLNGHLDAARTAVCPAEQIEVLRDAELAPIRPKEVTK